MLLSIEIEKVNSVMTSKTEILPTLEERILDVENHFGRLQREIEEIGLPAGLDLQRRLEELKIEEQAVRRDIVGYLLDPDPDPSKVEKIERLLQRIADEELSVQDDADFLNQSAPSSVSLAVEAGAHLVGLYRRVLRRLIRDHHPLGESVFVNQTHDDLAARFGIDDAKESAKTGSPQKMVDPNL